MKKSARKSQLTSSRKTKATGNSASSDPDVQNALKVYPTATKAVLAALGLLATALILVPYLIGLSTASGLGLMGLGVAIGLFTAVVAGLQYERVKRRLIQLVGQDFLTSVGNQRAFWDTLGKQVALAKRSTRPLSLILLDIDNFKAINDKYGHPTGDRVLRMVSNCVAITCRGSDQVFRYGGDEFAVICPDTNLTGARNVASRIQDSFKTIPESYPPISTGVGIAEFGDLLTGTDLLDAADSALIAAKLRKRNGLQVTDSARQEVKLPPQEEIAFARRRALELAFARAEDHITDPVEHSESVERLVVLVGKRLNIDGPELARLRLASRVHDLGKIAIPAEVMEKAGALNDEEWQTVRSHPVVGESILSSIPELDHLANIVRHSHERWDGDGYPDGLAGQYIPLESRIIFVCDSLQALRHERPYRAAMSTDVALQHLLDGAGTQFDPTVVTALVELVSPARPNGGNISLLGPS